MSVEPLTWCKKGWSLTVSPASAVLAVDDGGISVSGLIMSVYIQLLCKLLKQNTQLYSSLSDTHEARIQNAS